MPKIVNRNQALELCARFLTQVDWKEVDGNDLQREIMTLSPKDFGQRFTSYIKDGAPISRFWIVKLLDDLNPVAFFGDGWSIWRGPADGDGLKGSEDSDLRENTMAEINWAKVLLRSDASKMTGEEKLAWLRTEKKILLGKKSFLGLWQDYLRNDKNGILERLYTSYKIVHVDFFGCIFRSPEGWRVVPCFRREDDSLWSWIPRILKSNWNVSEFTALCCTR